MQSHMIFACYLNTSICQWNDALRTDFSYCWCWLRIAIRFTCTGIGTTIFGLFMLSACVRPCTSPALTRFHFARRFWNQIFTCTSLSFNACAIWERSVNDKYFLLWNSFSNSNSCSDVNAVRRRLVFPDVKTILPALLPSFSLDMSRDVASKWWPGSASSGDRSRLSSHRLPSVSKHSVMLLV